LWVSLIPVRCFALFWLLRHRPNITSVTHSIMTELSQKIVLEVKPDGHNVLAAHRVQVCSMKSVKTTGAQLYPLPSRCTRPCQENSVRPRDQHNPRSRAKQHLMPRCDSSSLGRQREHRGVTRDAAPWSERMDDVSQNRTFFLRRKSHSRSVPEVGQAGTSSSRRRFSRSSH